MLHQFYSERICRRSSSSAPGSFYNFISFARCFEYATSRAARRTGTRRERSSHTRPIPTLVVPTMRLDRLVERTGSHRTHEVAQPLLPVLHSKGAHP